MPPPARPPEATLYHNLRVSSRDAKILACRESPVSGGESTPGQPAALGHLRHNPSKSMRHAKILFVTRTSFYPADRYPRQVR